jgi:hypothetical protein
MSNDLVRAALAMFVLAHGIGHVLFMPIADSVMKLPQAGHSWLLSNVLNTGVSHAVATLAAAAAIALFVGAAYRPFVQAP